MFRIDISVFDEAFRNNGVWTFYVTASSGWRFYTGAMFPDNVGALLILFQLFPGPCVLNPDETTETSFRLKRNHPDTTLSDDLSAQGRAEKRHPAGFRYGERTLFVTSGIEAFSERLHGRATRDQSSKERITCASPF
jgi:hypothetical protein